MNCESLTSSRLLRLLAAVSHILQQTLRILDALQVDSLEAIVAAVVCAGVRREGWLVEEEHDQLREKPKEVQGSLQGSSTVLLPSLNEPNMATFAVPFFG